jgi:hypothetical protein
MKYLVILVSVALAACSPAPAEQPKKADETVYLKPDKDGCVVDSSAKLVTEHKVGPITNLVKDTVDLGTRGSCTVNFDLVVNGESHHLTETVEGWEQLPSLCYYATERARKNLLLSLGGTFKAQAVVACLKQDG